MQSTSATTIHFFASLWLLFCHPNESARSDLLAPIPIFLIFHCYSDAKLRMKRKIVFIDSSTHCEHSDWTNEHCFILLQNNDIHLIQYHDEEKKNTDWYVSICVKMPSEACAHVFPIFHLSTIVKSMMKIKESFHMSFVWQSEFSKEVEERRKCHNIQHMFYSVCDNAEYVNHEPDSQRWHVERKYHLLI